MLESTQQRTVGGWKELIITERKCCNKYFKRKLSRKKLHVIAGIQNYFYCFLNPASQLLERAFFHICA